MATIRSPFDRSPVSTIIGIVIAVAVLYVLFSIVGWILSLLYKYSFVILIAALIVDHRVVLNYVKAIKSLFDRNPVYGLIATLATFAFYPFVFLYFLGAGLFKKKIREAQQEADIRRNGQWTDFEDVSDRPVDIDADYRELPPPPEPRRRTEGDYDQYFK